MQMFHTTVSEASIARVVEVLRSGFLNEGDVVREFETGLAQYLGASRVVTTNSATSALHLCLKHLGIGEGDEVIIPPQTFVATGLAVLHAGATPIFADVGGRTGNIDPSDLARKITKKTRAVIPVHWGGYPCAMDEIHAVAIEHGIAVIEDAAHAFGAKFGGKFIGQVSRYTCFSFQAIKGMTTGDGGAISVHNDADGDQLVRMRWFGMKKGEAPPSDIGERSAAITTLGYKYHMNNVAAAIGIGNLADYPMRIARRKAIAHEYSLALENFPGIQHIEQTPTGESAFWLYPILVERRADFGRAMKSRNVPVSVIDRRIDMHPIFGGLRTTLDGAAYFDEHQIHLPVHEALGDVDVATVIDAIKAGW